MYAKGFSNDLTENIHIFYNTKRFCEESGILRAKIRFSINNSIIYLDDVLPISNDNEKNECKVTVTNKRTVEAARAYKGKSAILNLSCAAVPGGNVFKGANSQEERVCRVSTLYPCLATEKNRLEFYSYHRCLNDYRNSDRVIYIPNIVVFKDDGDFPEVKPEKEWFEVDVINASSPNLAKKDTSLYEKENWEELKEVFVKRITKVFSIAHAHKIDNLVIGAYGCGSCHNPPLIVAKAFKEVIDNYSHAFSNIEFAIYHKEGDSREYDTFKSILS